MKTNFYILIVFLLTVSLGHAQSTEEAKNVESVKTVTVDDNVTKENEGVLIDASELKETIARSASDIRIYFNRQRKVGNISLVFPKINKAVKA